MMVDKEEYSILKHGLLDGKVPSFFQPITWGLGTGMQHPKWPASKTPSKWLKSVGLFTFILADKVLRYMIRKDETDGESRRP